MRTQPWLKRRWTIALVGLALALVLGLGQLTLASPPPNLAREILQTAHQGDRYNLYLANSLDLAIGNGQDYPPRLENLSRWLHKVLVERVGWTIAQQNYVREIDTNFSPAEQQELLKLLQTPLIQKLWQAESAAYKAGTADRRRRMFTVWDDYNSSRLNPPPDVF